MQVTGVRRKTLTNQMLARPAVDRRGFTLLELMLVLALIVMIGALSLPAMRGPFENYKLKKAGDQVRVQWSKARILAMKSGQIQMFRFVLGEGSFSVAPYMTDQDYLETDLEHAGTAQFGTNATAPQLGSGGQMPIGSAGSAPGMQTDQNRQLPDGVVFAGGFVKSDTRSLEMSANNQGALTMETGGSEPILFYPDGTTSDAEVSLSNAGAMYVRVTLRGLTGTAKTGPLMTAEEWQKVEQAMQTSTSLQ